MYDNWNGNNLMQIIKLKIKKQIDTLTSLNNLN